MLKMVDGTGIIGVDMVCPLGVSTPQPPNYDRVELEGAGMLVLPNSLDAPLERLELGGKTEQNQDPPPSPEYLQEIKNSGKWNEETQKYEVDVKITGKNLFDKCLLEGGEIVEFNGVECYKYKDDSNNFKYKGKFKNGQRYALTTRILRPESKKSYGTYIKFKYEDGTDSVLTAKHGVLKTLVSNIGKTIDSIIGNYNYSTDCYLDLSVTRLSSGGQDSGYQPYKEQTLTLTSDRPITKWDRLVEQGGEIGWLYKHKIIEDFSTLVKDTEPIYGNDGGKFFSVSLQNASLNYDRSKIYSEVGIYGKDNKKYYIPEPMTASTIIYVSDTDTIMIAKEHMHYKVVYETVDSEFVPLPQSEQNAIRALKTYYPTTVITVDGGEVDPDIKVTYRKEI